MEQRDAGALARRLRKLRQARNLTQNHVARALGVAVSSVSSWESTTSVKPPPPNRLAEYAALFARAADPPRLVPDAELDAAERAERDRLAAELDRLRLSAVGEPADPAHSRPHSMWHFPDGGHVRLICGKLPKPPDNAKARSHNYLQLSAYADVDAMVELYGQLRAENPASSVGYDLSARLEPDDLRSHLVLFGSASMNSTVQRTAELIDLPVRQVDDPSIADGEVFELTDGSGQRFLPKFIGEEGKGEVVEDVGWFFRAPNPYNVDRTLTICSGVFTRGVFGAVKFLTDRLLHEENELVLAHELAGAETFSLLLRVPVFDHATVTPDLRNPDSILHAWAAPGPTG